MLMLVQRRHCPLQRSMRHPKQSLACSKSTRLRRSPFGIRPPNGASPDSSERDPDTPIMIVVP
jgi:hypothetical protein